MTETRIVLIDMPRLLRDVVRSVLDTRPNLRVVAEVTSDAGPATVPADVDVVVSGVDSPALVRVLGMRPPTPVVLIAADGADGFVCTPIGDLSPDVILAVVHSVRP